MFSIPTTVNPQVPGSSPGRGAKISKGCVRKTQPFLLFPGPCIRYVSVSARLGASTSVVRVASRCHGYSGRDAVSRCQARHRVTSWLGQCRGACGRSLASRCRTADWNAQAQPPRCFGGSSMLSGMRRNVQGPRRAATCARKRSSEPVRSITTGLAGTLTTAG